VPDHANLLHVHALVVRGVEHLEQVVGFQHLGVIADALNEQVLPLAMEGVDLITQGVWSSFKQA
jgi:hypothetical protein